MRCFYGWGTRIRTLGWRNQNPLPYRLAIPQYKGLKEISGTGSEI